MVGMAGWTGGSQVRDLENAALGRWLCWLRDPHRPKRPVEPVQGLPDAVCVLQKQSTLPSCEYPRKSGEKEVSLESAERQDALMQHLGSAPIYKQLPSSKRRAGWLRMSWCWWTCTASRPVQACARREADGRTSPCLDTWDAPLLPRVLGSFCHLPDHSPSPAATSHQDPCACLGLPPIVYQFSVPICASFLVSRFPAVDL